MFSVKTLKKTDYCCEPTPVEELQVSRGKWRTDAHRFSSICIPTCCRACRKINPDSFIADFRFSPICLRFVFRSVGQRFGLFPFGFGSSAIRVVPVDVGLKKIDSEMVSMIFRNLRAVSDPIVCDRWFCESLKIKVYSESQTFCLQISHVPPIFQFSANRKSVRVQ